MSFYVSVSEASTQLLKEQVLLKIEELAAKYGDVIPTSELRDAFSVGTPATATPVSSSTTKSTKKEPKAASKESKPTATKVAAAKAAASPGGMCCGVTKKDKKPCSKTGKDIGPDGKRYCGIHIKEANKLPATSSNDSFVEKQVNFTAKVSVRLDPRTGLLLDANKIVYVEDYKGEGPHGYAILTNEDKLIEIPSEIVNLCTENQIFLLPADERTKKIAETEVTTSL